MHTKPQPCPTIFTTGGHHLASLTEDFIHVFSSIPDHPAGCALTPGKRENEP